MLDFQNNSLNIDDLPRFEHVETFPVESSYLKMLRLVYGFLLFLAIGALTAFMVFGKPRFPDVYLLIGGVLLIFTIIIIEIEKGFKIRKYGIREKDILFQKGFFLYKETIVPYKRIQHIELRQSLIFKAFKLYSLKIYTAGSSTGDLSIRGLNRIEADKIKAQILKVADLDED